MLILDEAIVMRTPRDVSGIGDMQSEIRLLGYLKDKVDVGIPVYEYFSEDGTIAGYRMLPGRDLWDGRVFRAMSDDDKQILAQMLAGFLSVLHSTPAAVIEQIHSREEDQRAGYENLKTNIDTLLRPRLSALEMGVLAKHLEELDEALRDGYRNVLTHCDLRPEHILWDEQSKKVSVIDFADFALTDPAIDFTMLFELGADFVDKVYSLYGGNKDSNLLHRAELYFRREAPDLMIMALQGYPCTFEEGYEMFRDRFLIR